MLRALAQWPHQPSPDVTPQQVADLLNIPFYDDIDLDDAGQSATDIASCPEIASGPTPDIQQEPTAHDGPPAQPDPVDLTDLALRLERVERILGQIMPVLANLAPNAIQSIDEHTPPAPNTNQ